MRVPRLRFCGYGHEWKTDSLENVTTYVDYRGKTPEKSEGGIFLVTAKNIRQGYIDYKSSKEFIPISTYEEVMRRGKPAIGDVLITTEAPLGYVASVDRDDIALAQRVIKFRGAHDVIQNAFLKYYLSSVKFQKELNDKATGGTVKGIKGSILHKMKLSFSSVEEQTKIANFLTAVDEKIVQLTQKFDLLTQYKKGVMQKIFSQELRFKNDDRRDFPEWEERKIKDVAQIVGGGTPDTGVKEYWNGSVQWFTPTELKSKYAARSQRTITEEGFKNSSAKILPVGALLFSSRATVGDVSIALNTCTTNQGFQSMIVNDKNNNEFIYYWIVNNKKTFLEKASGSTFLEISKKEIEKLSIQLPVIKEQKKIANFLAAIDDKITNAKKQLEAAKQYKQGLLQQMFI